ncbi:hypothetical protein C8R45DRAFT_974682 [Mycena sanguinolenta]|nr:hypothetical protein C8R45DRAFT_974682 [Mycena sanguinolenta]
MLITVCYSPLGWVRSQRSSIPSTLFLVFFLLVSWTLRPGDVMTMIQLAAQAAFVGESDELLSIVPFKRLMLLGWNILYLSLEHPVPNFDADALPPSLALSPTPRPVLPWIHQ